MDLFYIVTLNIGQLMLATLEEKLQSLIFFYVFLHFHLG